MQLYIWHTGSSCRRSITADLRCEQDTFPSKKCSLHTCSCKKKTFLAKVRLQLVFFLEHVTKHHEIPKVRPSIISIYIRSNKNPSYDECVDTTVRDTSICCARFLLSDSVLFLFHHLCSDDNLVSDSPPPLLSFSLIFAFSQWNTCILSPNRAYNLFKWICL